VYPAPTGVLATYSKTELYSMLDHAVRAYDRVEEEMLGPVFKNSSLQLCFTQYRSVRKVSIVIQRTRVSVLSYD
jgi:hypothetical protein